jgi:hypothetical protein
MRSRLARDAMIVTSIVFALVLVGFPSGNVATANASCPSGPGSGHWIGDYTANGNSGYWWDADFVNDGNGHVSGQITALNGAGQGPNTWDISVNCGDFNGTLVGVAPVPVITHATMSADGDSITDGSWAFTDGTNYGTWSGALITRTASAADATTLTTDPDHTGPTPQAPLQVDVVAPVAGNLSVSVGSADAGVQNGYQLLNQIVHIQAPTTTADTPMQFTFALDASTLLGAPPSEVTVFRNGAVVADCDDPNGSTATPDPCVASRVPLDQGGVQITVRTSAASIWAFGVNQNRGGFRITTTNLPAGRIGQPYLASLAATSGTAPYRWAKLGKSRLPKGLRISAKLGLITGTPKSAGSYPFFIKVRDTAKPHKITTAAFVITVT